MSSQAQKSQQNQQAKRDLTNKANRYCAIAIILMCIALGFYGIGVFLISPQSIVGIVSACLGLLCMAGSITNFVLYARYLKKAESN